MTKIGVIGAGAWGTALAQTYAVEGKPITLWAREDDVVQSINTGRENTLFLKGVPLSSNITATTDLLETARCDILLMVTPAQHLRATLNAIRNEIKSQPVVLCAKGIEMQTGKLLSAVAEEEIPGINVCVLTGPTFASEIARGLPSAVTIGAHSKDAAEIAAEMLASKTLRPYASGDIIGAEIGGAVKNVIAIASGIIQGKGLGESARAALVTRGLAEIGRLAEAMGGKRETLMGLCGMGDMMLTCSSMQSRNFSLGVMLGQGKSLANIMAERNSVAEGVHTARAVTVLAERAGVDMPISTMVDQCLNHGLDLDTGIKQWMNRPLKHEGE